MQTAKEMARDMAEKSPLSLSYAKEALDKGLDLTLDQGIKMDWTSICSCSRQRIASKALRLSRKRGSRSSKAFEGIMSGFETVIYEKNGSIACVTLNRPQALNAFSVQMRDDLFEILGAIKADDEVRAVLLEGAGDKAFCAGADLREFLTAPSAVKARHIRSVRDLWRLF